MSCQYRAVTSDVLRSWSRLMSLRPCRTLKPTQPFCFASIRSFNTSPTLFQTDTHSGNAYTQPAHNLSQDVTKEEQSHWDKVVAEGKQKQIKTPWHREGSDQAPVSRPRSASAMTKGKLLTTPSRMLKLILPLTTHDHNSDRKDVEPLALLVHPQQPLSYLERLIQSELPVVKDENGKDRVPAVYFRAEDSMQDSIAPKQSSIDEKQHESDEEDHEADDKALDDPDTTMIDGRSARTGKLGGKKRRVADALRGGPGEGGVESYSGLGHEGPPSSSSSSSSAAEESGDDKASRFVRWSSSTEIGDFIRDAARGRQFAVEIQGAPRPIYVGVPSFMDRTFYLRMRLRKKSREIAQLADIKRECDRIAEKHAKRFAMAGGVGLIVWWAIVYELTFRTELGWDVMEPVTYLVGLSSLIGGYGWFLVHNRQVSYRSAMNYTISRRQSRLYDQKGFDLRRWEDLIDEGNKLRREIKLVAQEYDVEWDEKEDEESEKVIEALKEERRKKKNGGKKEGKDGEDEED